VVLFYKIFDKFLLRWWAALLTVIVIAAYSVLAGAEPPVLRAAFMGALVLFGRELGRSSAGLNTLAFSAALLAVFQPDLPWDPSFQLSFAATLGLVLYGNRLDGWFRDLSTRKLPTRWAVPLSVLVSDFVLMTLAAQLATLPIMIYHFQRLSLSALLSNPLVLPPQPYVMVLAGIAVIAGLVWLPLGRLLGALAWPFAAYTNRMVSLLSGIPGGSIPLPGMSVALAVVLYVILFAFTCSGSRRLLQGWLKPALVLGLSGTLAILAWQGFQARPDGLLHLLLYNSGGQPAVLVTTPGGQALLINGSGSAELESAVSRRLSPFDHRLDGFSWLHRAANLGTHCRL
jgi:competence protein ComEC